LGSGIFLFLHDCFNGQAEHGISSSAPTQRRENGVAAGWHSRPGFDVFSKTAQDPTNEKHHLLSQVLNGAFL
jgi:hypothetical protein